MSGGRAGFMHNTWRLKRYLFALFVLVYAAPLAAHHVLGRPSYSLGEDSNTPPSMQVETQIGDYYVTYMVFPAFPQPGDQGRVNLYATRIDNGESFAGEVTFLVRDDSWFSSEQETLGRQSPDDAVFRQGFVFKESGDYIITAQFFAQGEPYQIDFPLRIGDSASLGPIGIAVALIALLLIVVNVVQRKRMQRLKAVQHHHDEPR